MRIFCLFLETVLQHGLEEQTVFGLVVVRLAIVNAWTRVDRVVMFSPHSWLPPRPLNVLGWRIAELTEPNGTTFPYKRHTRHTQLRNLEKWFRIIPFPPLRARFRYTKPRCLCIFPNPVLSGYCQTSFVNECIHLFARNAHDMRDRGHEPLF